MLIGRDNVFRVNFLHRVVLCRSVELPSGKPRHGRSQEPPKSWRPSRCFEFLGRDLGDRMVGDCRKILGRLRRDHNLSRTKLAAMLGTTVDTLRRWEDGSRKPSGPSRKLIWLVSTMFEGNPPETVLDLILWNFGKNGGASQAA